jgi:hypothetical protein
MRDFGDNAGAETVGHQQPYHTEGCELYTQELNRHLSETLALPAEAVHWLMDVWACIQLFDDVADKDPITRHELDRVIWASLVAMPANPFFDAKKGALLPVLTTMILKWQASDIAERSGQADARSYVWRAGYYDLVLMAVHLCHGVETATKLAPTVMNLYGETLTEYMKEFANA